jgi:excisionase family DNA binding protein
MNHETVAQAAEDALNKARPEGHPEKPTAVGELFVDDDERFEVNSPPVGKGDELRLTQTQWHGMSEFNRLKEINAMDGDRVLTIGDAATHLACKPAAVKKWIRTKSLPSVKVGRLRRIRRSALEAFIRGGASPAS